MSARKFVKLDAPWRKRASCRDILPPYREIFYPESNDYETLKIAKSICAGCPVQQPCLEFALTHHELGVWGGTSERERRRIRQARKENGTAVKQ